MPVTLTAWGKTGYNSVNIPKNRQSLPDNYIVLNDIALDLCQIYGLASISIPCDEVTANRIDYIMLSRGETERSFYSVTDIPDMSSGDVAKIPVIQDPILTLGGASNINIRAGAIVRTSRGANSYVGRNDLIDHMFVPRYPARKKYMSVENWPEDLGADGYQAVVAASIDLSNPRAGSTVEELQKIYKIDPDTGQVTANYTPTVVSAYTDVEIPMPPDLGAPSTVPPFTTRTVGYGLFAWGHPKVNANLSALWSMNQIDGVMQAYLLPKRLFDFTIDSNGHISKIVCKPLSVSFEGFFETSGLYTDYTGPEAEFVRQNANLATFSSQYKIGIVSALSGNQLVTKAYNTTKKIHIIADPRLGGKPYFIMPDQLRETGVEAKDYDIAMLFTRSIPGAEWQSVPITYKGALGWASAAASLTIKDDVEEFQTRMGNVNGMYQQAGSIANDGFRIIEGGVNWETRDYDNSRRAIARGGVGKYIDSTTPSFGGGLIGGSLDILGNAIGGLGNMAGISDEVTGAISSNSRNNMIRKRQTQRDISQYLIDYHFVAPTVRGIPNTTWQGLIGNGVILYVEYPDPEDIKTWGRIVRAFGLVSNQVLSGDKSVSLDSYVQAEDKCGYIQATGTVVTSHSANASMALLQDASDALAAGIRFWKSPPNS